MYFSFFKPPDWRKRSVVRGRRFIQRFPGVYLKTGNVTGSVKRSAVRVRWQLEEYTLV